VTELHVHDWSPWGPSPLSETAGVPRRQRSCRGCDVYQDEPAPAGDQPAPKDAAMESAISAGLDAWHVACHAGETQLQGIRRVLAAAVPHIERAIRHRIADELRIQAEHEAPNAAEALTVDSPPPDDLLYDAWVVIANANGGDWQAAAADWREAAERWRDKYHETLRASAEPDWRSIAAQLAEAIRLTREYVGDDLLPAQPGWSWYDAMQRFEQAGGPPDAALGRCQAMLQCHRETGHEGGHEAHEENRDA
jgi:hypothetical protein